MCGKKDMDLEKNNHIENIVECEGGSTVHSTIKSNAINDFEKKVIGYRELRNNLSNIMANVIYDGVSVVCGNVKKNDDDTAAIISTKLLKSILDAVSFGPSFAYDHATNQYEAFIDEIDVQGFGDTIEELKEITVDNVLDMTEDYFENIDKYIRFDKYKKMYPYYLKIQNCKSKNEILEVLSMKDIKISKGG